MAWLIVVMGALGVQAGRLRASAAEPTGLSEGPGLVVGVEGRGDLEHRSPPLSQPLQARAAGGRKLRAAGVGLCALGLLLALRPAAGWGGRPRGWTRLLWAGPGALGVWALAFPWGTHGVGVGLGVLLLFLSLSLLAAWRE